ncbi:sulfite exporter TauE/SafE family protein [Brachybacterium alimentarium]|uniref:sulfite exporter TauE/SafE family protein n=2 Tax=Brachybacterium alimentarium TaxID=47845 RepID=UPI000DF3CB87|nr:sulfite exporter TauE/SafE family protein [Brachybacterium alimentarium]RCS83437.1 sulfite exporter TauE/SafE family protein [Brachybacterium alimentarium]
MSDLAALIPTLGTATWVLVMIGALVVGLSKTAMPGGGTIAVGVFALALPAKESTAALLLLLMVGDATALWVYRREPDVRTLVRLIPSVLLGIVLGTVFFATVGGDTVRTTIGVILLVLIAVTVWRRRAARVKKAGPVPSATPAGDPSGASPATATPVPAPAPSGPGVAISRAGYGVLGGFTTMVANAGGPVMSMYFYAMRMPVLTFLGTSAWFFAIVNVIKLPFSAGLGLITRDTLVMDLMLVPLVLIGAYCGAKIARRIPQGVFEKLILVLTVVSALALLVL